MNPIYIASDIHGSLYYAKLFFEKVDKANPFKVILLGDCYYNGARNTPPKDYSPKDVVILLNAHADKIICAKGNCESEVDQWVSEFPIVDMASLYLIRKLPLAMVIIMDSITSLNILGTSSCKAIPMSGF